MKHLILSLFFLAISTISIGQCSLNTGTYTEVQVLSCLSIGGSVVIPTGQIATMDGDWNLSSMGDIFFTIEGTGSLVFTGTGSNVTTLMLGEGSTLSISDPSNSLALTSSSPSSSNQVVVTFLGTPTVDFIGGDMTDIITGGGASNNGIGTLPIELLFFSAESDQHIIQLEWVTASEENNDYFTILKSQDCLEWYEQGKVKGAGNSSTVNNYSFIDYDQSNNTIYYQLKQTDFDGKYTSSKIVQVERGNNHSSDKVIYLSPYEVEIVVSYDNIKIEDTRIYNVMGSDVTSRSIISLKNDHSFTVNMTYLKSGFYYVRTPKSVYKIFNK